MKKTGLLVSLLFICVNLFAQSPTALLKGKVMDDKNNPIEGVNISVKEVAGGTRSDEKGLFSLPVPADKNIKIVFSTVSFETNTLFKRLAAGETSTITVTMKSNVITTKTVVIKDDRRRNEAGSVRIDPKLYDKMPSIVGGIEGQLKIFLSNNNELTSQYNVRGGNFDENLVYINDFEVYRPFLVRSGQQEGLSIINPELVDKVNFSTGGFQSKYGDKMSSVLDITYKRPKEFAGSVSLSLLGFGAHLEGTGIKKRLSYMVGVRQKSNQYLLQAQQTKGVYNPTFTDIQAFINYQFDTDWQVDVFANYARNRFDFQPASSTQSFGLNLLMSKSGLENSASSSSVNSTVNMLSTDIITFMLIVLLIILFQSPRHSPDFAVGFEKFRVVVFDPTTGAFKLHMLDTELALFQTKTI